jgi:outer membrane cobalamin receptor
MTDSTPRRLALRYSIRTLASGCFLLGAIAGETSNIQGTVLDPSGRAIEGAAVSCNGRTAFSNAEGRFALPVRETCDGTIEKAGFKSKSVKLRGEDARIQLELQGPVENVVVSATGAQTTPEQAAVAANVVDEPQFALRDYPMMFDILRELPGLQISDYGRRGALTQIYTRGAERTGTLVMLDGVPLNDPGGELHLESIGTEGIDRVEVVRGPQSALFGAEAAASVVQLFTKRGDSETSVPHGSASYERGDFQTDRWAASLNGGLFGRLDYFLEADQFHTVGEFQDDYYRDTTGTADLGYRISNSTQLRGIFRMYDAHVGTPGQVGYGIFDLPANEETRDATVAFNVDDSRGPNFSQRFSFAFHRLSDRYNDDELFSEQNLAALVSVVPGPQQKIFFVSLLNPNGPLPAPSQLPAGIQLVQTTYFFGPSDSLNLTERKIAAYQGTLSHRHGAIVFGYQYQRQSGVLSGVNAERDNHGGFFNVQQNFGSRLFLDGGARIEHSSAFGNIGSGRGGASFLLFREHGPLSSTVFRLSGGRGVTEPSLLENYAQSPFFHGNPTLKPEDTTTYEAGIVQEWYGRRIRTEVAAFRSSFHNLIAFVGDTWQNVEASWARGIETSAQAKLPFSLLLTGTYMRLYTRVTASESPESSTTGIGYELVHRPRNSGAVTLALTPRKWSFAMGGRFVGERQDADFNFGTNRNPGYESVFLSASYRATKHITPVLRIDNLLNERYEEVLGYTALSRSVIGGVRIGW